MKVFIHFKGFLICLLLGIISQVVAQAATEFVSGKVTDQHGPLVGANIYWAGTTIGTVSAPDGTFRLENKDNYKTIVISYTGYTSDTVNVTEITFLDINLKASVAIDKVEIFKRRKTTSFSLIDPIKAEKIGEGELLKAACCNLSESFETNASVDVSFTDAITGTKQIQMLGLAGPYSQITRENIPDIRGLSAIYGMEYIPGTWIESIQLNKGTGSVVNGYESIAGQINVELRKPESADRLYFNVYGNEDSRVEANLNLKQKINDQLSTGLLIHARTQKMEMDRNSDGFMDKPLGDQLILLNRWKLFTKSNWESQLGIKVTYNGNKGGQLSELEVAPAQKWGMNMETRRLEGWLKAGKVFENKPTQSIGMQFSGLVHDQSSTFGLKDYEGTQASGYANFIFQSNANVYHTYKLGTSFMYDQFHEVLDSIAFDREEIVPGIFGEYMFSPNNNFDVVAGLRADYHNNFGLFFTPRLHVRYALAERSVLRLSAGKGQRTASILAENNGIFASSRIIKIVGNDDTTPYGLKQEKAWNYGVNFTQKFRLDYRDGAFSMDAYQTRFIDQVIVDWENPREVTFYNLEGKSVATSIQAQVDYELIRRLDARIAYRWHDVKTQYQTGYLEKPLSSSHKAFLNLGYTTRHYWSFDYTVHWQGSKRIPSTQGNPPEYQLESNSPDFYLMNTQISKSWAEKFDIYLGVENLLNFKQENPILAADNPFSDNFDASLIWGPVFGRMFYGGIRLKIK